MDRYQRHKIIWRALQGPVQALLWGKFNLKSEPITAEGPVLLVPNHVCAWDPLIVAMSLKQRPLYYVASEHLFRLGPVTKILEALVAPIPRRKATTGSDTVKACLRHLRAGHSVCIFGEGEQCWDGRNIPVFPATGKLAKSSGATLVTYRLEGGYLSCPRWGKGVRRGKVHGHPVGIYPPEELKKLSAKQVNDLINRDIWEDAWQRQKTEKVLFRGKRRAEGLERALYLCPRCRRIGTLRTKNDRLYCGCGLELCYTESGLFAPEKPFSTIAQWEDWQRKALKERSFPHKGDLLFSDGEIQLSRIGSGHSEEKLGLGLLEQHEEYLLCAGRRFPMREIRNMAPVQSHLLLFLHEGEYYQLRTRNGANLRKYMEIWKELQGE